MNTIPRPLFRRRNVLRVLPAFLLAFLFQACTKESFVTSPIPTPIPIPIPIRPINLYPTQTPFKTFITKYNIPITETNSAIGLTAVDFGLDTRSGMIYDQAEVGFAFRSSVAGVVNALGTMLPASGFIHTVTLWDSATQTVLANANVTSQSTSTFTYVDFSTTVPIQANHGYVVGFNTLAMGNPANTYSPGNSLYAVNGLFVDGGQARDLPLFPFTTGTITVENGFSYNYGDGRPPANLFPASSTWNDQPNGFVGLCDVAFVQ
jgi:hypothetical protein